MRPRSKAHGRLPLTDPELIDEIIESHLASGADYTSNTLKPTYPDGLDAEVFKFGALCQAWEHATLPSHREHVTPYIYNHPELFSLNSFEAEEDLSDHRWTVDESEDFQFVSEVYQYFLDKMPFVSTEDILQLISLRPDLRLLNTSIGRNEGAQSGLAKDEEFLRKLSETTNK